jgi:hypothetical protein
VGIVIPPGTWQPITLSNTTISSITNLSRRAHCSARVWRHMRCYNTRRLDEAEKGNQREVV